MRWPFQRRADPSRASASVRNQAREELTAAMVSLPCGNCGAEAGDGCDRGFPGGTLVVLVRFPPLFAHAARIADVLALHPHIRYLVLAQFEPGTLPGELSGDRP